MKFADLKNKSLFVGTRVFGLKMKLYYMFEGNGLRLLNLTIVKQMVILKREQRSIANFCFADKHFVFSKKCTKPIYYWFQSLEQKIEHKFLNIALLTCVKNSLSVILKHCIWCFKAWNCNANHVVKPTKPMQLITCWIRKFPFGRYFGSLSFGIGSLRRTR